MYKPNPSSPYRVKFDFRVDFENGGHVQGQDFLLDLDGSAVDEAALAQMIVDSMNLARSGPVTIFRQQVVPRGQHDDAAPAAAPPDPATAFAARIAAIAPELTVATAVFNGEGLINDVVIVNERLVFRFAKSERGRAALAGELQVLRAIRAGLPLPIPDPFFASPEAMAYERVPGVSLTPSRLRGLDPLAQQAIAHQLGDCLRALHSAPVSGPLPATRAYNSRADWEALWAEIEATVIPLMMEHQQDWARGLFDDFLADPRRFEYEQRLIHGDLWPEHVLYDPASSRLTGLIDFGMAGLGDPATDLGNLLQSYGETFVRRIFAHYPAAAGLMQRARFYAAAFELDWPARGLTSGQTFWFAAHLGNARDLYPSHA